MGCSRSWLIIQNAEDLLLTENESSALLSSLCFRKYYLMFERVLRWSLLYINLLVSCSEVDNVGQGLSLPHPHIFFQAFKPLEASMRWQRKKRSKMLHFFFLSNFSNNSILPACSGTGRVFGTQHCSTYMAPQALLPFGSRVISRTSFPYLAPSRTVTVLKNRDAILRDSGE